jgi:hypothetical protein
MRVRFAVRDSNPVVRIKLTQCVSLNLQGHILDEPAWAGERPVVIGLKLVQSVDHFIVHGSERDVGRQFPEQRISIALIDGIDCPVLKGAQLIVDLLGRRRVLRACVRRNQRHQCN